MPKLVLAVPKYRKKTRPGSAPQAVTTINGRDHYLGLYSSKASRLEYDRLVNQWLASGRSPRFGLPDEQLEEPTLKELMNAYRKWCEKHYRDKDGTPTTTLATMKPLMRRLREWYGATPVSKFTPLALKDVVRRSIDEGLSVSTINSWISRIKHMFRWGVAEELVRPDTKLALDSVRGEQQGRTEAKPRRIIEAVPSDMVDQTLPHLPPIIRDMVQLQRFTGMRPAEVLQIRPCDIQKVDGVWLYSPSRHKTEHHGKSRIVVIAGKAQEILSPYVDGEPTDYCFSPERSLRLTKAKRSAARIIPLSQGNRPKADWKRAFNKKYDSNAYRKAIHRGCETAFGKDGYKWSPNQLRHAMAERIQSSAGIEAVAAVLGHSKIDMSQHYAKHNLSLAIETMKKIG